MKTVSAILDRFDALSELECDGFTRVASYALREAGIAHQAMYGLVGTPRHELSPHFWIEVDGWIVDYRLRMNAGSDMPHGVFKPPPGIVYCGQPCLLQCGRELFLLLTMEWPSEWAEQMKKRKRATR